MKICAPQEKRTRKAGVISSSLITGSSALPQVNRYIWLTFFIWMPQKVAVLPHTLPHTLPYKALLWCISGGMCLVYPLALPACLCAYGVSARQPRRLRASGVGWRERVFDCALGIRGAELGQRASGMWWVLGVGVPCAFCAHARCAPMVETTHLNRGPSLVGGPRGMVRGCPHPFIVGWGLGV